MSWEKSPELNTNYEILKKIKKVENKEIFYRNKIENYSISNKKTKVCILKEKIVVFWEISDFYLNLRIKEKDIGVGKEV